MPTLIVEDGSIVTGANTYVTISGVTDYADAYGYTTTWSGTTITDTIREQSVLKAMRYIESLPFRGIKQTSDQALEFPRSDLYDNSGYLMEENFIPIQLKNAVCEAAMLMLPTSEVDLQPSMTRDDYITGEKISSAISIAYGVRAGGFRSKSTIIEDLLNGYLKNKIIVEIKRG